MIHAISRQSLAGIALVCLIAGGWSESARAATVRHDVDFSAYNRYADLTHWQSVGKVTGNSATGRFSASGVMVRHNWILTAAHVVDDATSLTFTIGGKDYQAEGWATPDDWTGSLDRGGDIALVKLDRNITGFDFQPRYKQTEEMRRWGFSAGYGLGGTGLTGYQNGSSLTKRVGTNVIDWIRGGKMLVTDFDNPNDRTDNTIGSTDLTTFETAIAPGDSGGPMFIWDGRRWRIAGIASFGWATNDGDPDSDYGDLSAYTRVSSYRDWIQDVLDFGTNFDRSTSVAQLGSRYDWRFMGLQLDDNAEAVPTPTAAAMGLVVLPMLLRRRRRA